MILNMSALELSRAIKDKKITVVEATKAYLEQIEKKEGKLNAFITVTGEYALERAAQVQAQIDRGEELSPLAGVPIGIKDNISTDGILTTCASKILDGYIPVFSATVVNKLEAAGMIIVGKLNMDEMAMGGTSDTGVYGAVHNPWDLERTAGGSSGGSAAAVAGGEVPLSLGTDTGGSIRGPAAYTGATGIKPTYGAVSRYGVVAYGSSLDTTGVFGLDINDCAALLAILSGPCEKDSTCVIPKPFEFSIDSGDKLDGVKIGIPRNYFDDKLGIDSEVKQAVLDAAKELENAGAELIEFEMPLAEYIVPTYFAVAYAEASSNFARFDGLKYGHRSAEAKNLAETYSLTRGEGFGAEVKKRLLVGSLVLSAECYEEYYSQALKVRRMLKDAYSELFKQFDMILSPSTPTVAQKLGESVPDPQNMSAGGMYNQGVNLAGLPSVSLPCGLCSKGMPIGFQLIGNAFDEAKIINAAGVYQNRTTHHTKRAGGA